VRAPGRRAGAICLVLLHGHASAAASDKVDEAIQELLLGRIVYPQDALELQVTSALGAARAGGATLATAELEVELGLTDRLQVAAEIPLAWRSPAMQPAMTQQAGLGNAEVSVLYNPLSDRARGFAVSAGLGLAFPALSDAGTDAWGPEAFAVAYQVLGRVHLNLSVALGVELERGTGAGTEPEVALDGSLGVFVPLGRWVPVLELRAGNEDGPAWEVSAGALWHPIPELELGAAIQAGLDPRSIGGLVIATVELELADD